MKKIIITGANGFIGSYLAKFLKNEGHEITCLVRKGSNTELLDPRLEITYVDYRNEKQLEKIFSDKQILIHTAALTKAASWREFEKINISLSLELAKIANQKNLEQFIFISSQAAAGACSVPKTENEKCLPVSMYGKSKLLAEKELKKVLTIPYTFIRPASVFGPGERDFFLYFKLINNHFSFLIGKQKRSLSLIYVEDLVRLIAAAIGNPKAFNQIFFASDGNIYTWEKFAAELGIVMNKNFLQIRIPEKMVFLIAYLSELGSKITGRYPTLNREKVKEMKEKNWLISNQKANKALNFNAKYTLRNG
ncbi:MAG: NAD-dependent epimerase/dehydratase family protein, partial [Candidatus Cloacimonadota bacterium]|nr:NAD-dependent epimerase/dehydratase family protein [Candidatus Cloacimonadota bacterium]